MSTIPETQLPAPLQLTAGDRLPSFSLRAATGQTIRHSQYRGRCNLALVFLPEQPGARDEAFLRDLTAKQSELAETDSSVFVVTTQSADEALALAARVGLRAPMLLDPDRGVYRVYGFVAENRAQAGVVVADRYLQVWAISADRTLPDAMSVSDVMEWLRFIDFQCSECADVTSWAMIGRR